MPAYYRKLKSWKYELVRDFIVHTSITGYCNHTISTRFIDLLPNGSLRIRAGYAWDGPSGPTFDTPSFMRGSLIHDALYQLIRLGLLPKSARRMADTLLREVCLIDGMSRFRAWYVYQGVHLFAAHACEPKPSYDDNTIYQTR